MHTFRENTTVKLFKDIRNITSQPAYKHDRHLKGSKAKGVPKMYNGDTSKFEPIEANRQHLIHTLMPYVTTLAAERAKTFFQARIEFDDCISAGMEGATIATDLYIERAKTETHTAKLSTFAHFYITKYINEYINGNNTSLSHGTTKGREAMSFQVLAGNKTNEDSDNGKGEYFETSNDPALMSIMELNADNTTVDKISQEMFSVISPTEKTVLFMFFGISTERKYEIKEIAQHLKMTNYTTEQAINNAFTKIREKFKHIKDKSELISLLISGDLTNSVYWQK